MALEPLWTGSELLHKLLSDFLANKLPTALFCADVEAAYNDAVDPSVLTAAEQEAFEALFDEVVMFSPLPPESWEYPGYRTEEQIRAAAIEAADKLQRA